MVIKCCVFGCANVYKKKHRKLEDKNVSFLSFHRFPTNLEKKTTWISNVRQINGSTWQPVNLSFVCSEHFDCSSWEKIREDGERKLKFQAAPSIFNNNLSQKSRNDHIYSLKDITNRTISSMERNKLRLSVPDHSYSSKKVCSNRNLSTTASSIKETSVTTLNTTEKDISNTSEIESNLTDNENCDIVLNSSDVFTNTAEKDISNTSEIESNLIDNENSDIVLNNSDVFTNTCTIASSNASNILPEMIMEVENAITAETIEEQQIDIMTASLKNENEQLKKELARVKKIADKIHQENNTLRKSNKNLRRRNEILTNIQEKSESILTKFNKDQKKAMYKKNYRGIHWEPKTLKQALILKLKCGSSGYKEVQKQIPLPSIRTLQRRIKHIEFRPGFLEETLHLLADQINHNKEEWKDCVLALDEMSIQPGEMIDPNTNESIGRTTLASHSGVANKALVFLLGGIIFGWKQVICFHLTGSKAKDAKEGVTGQVYADIIKNIIERCETIGLRIHCVVSDMGSDNRSMWKVFGIMANRSEVISSIPHPVRPSSRLYIMPDVSHLFKSIRSMIIYQQ